MLCPFSILVQHPSGDGDEGDPRWISRWTTKWRVNRHEPLLCKLEQLLDRLDQVSRKYSLRQDQGNIYK